MLRIALAASTLVTAQAHSSALDTATDAFLSGLYVCRQVQQDPQNAEAAATAMSAEGWKPTLTPLGTYLRDGVRVFRSDDRKYCYVQTAARIDLGRLESWIEVAGALDGQIKRFEWNATRKRPLRGDVYRLWRWDSWRSASGMNDKILSHEIAVLPGATQSRPGEQSVTATISHRERKVQ